MYIVGWFRDASFGVTHNVFIDIDILQNGLGSVL
jgi:hypothetical protein